MIPFLLHSDFEIPEVLTAWLIDNGFTARSCRAFATEEGLVDPILQGIPNETNTQELIRTCPEELLCSKTFVQPMDQICH